MPVFDQQLGRVVVRVVYDGPGMAGKTTNVRQLNRIFSSSRSSVLDTFGETAGRTTFFDWFSMDSGLVSGYPLRTEFVTVPGQRVLARRRLALIEHADAIVFVVDATPSRISDARQMFLVLQEHLQRLNRQDIPVVVQVNKQDVSGAVSVAGARTALGIPEGVPAVAAQAEKDIGVRESAVLAIRAAANQAQEAILRSGVEALRGECGTPEKLRAHLEELEELQKLRPIEILRQHSAQIGAPASGESLGVSLVESGAEGPDDLNAGNREPGILRQEPVENPPLPDCQEEAGGVWPPLGGRDVLAKIPLGEARSLDLAEGFGRERATGGKRWGFRAGDFVLTTSAAQRTESLEAARKLLVQEVRRYMLIGQLLPERTVLSLQSDGHGGYWLWKTQPALRTVDEILRSALRTGIEAEVRGALHGAVSIIVRTSRLALEQGVVVVPRLTSFAQEDGELFCVGDEIAVENDLGALRASLRRLVESVFSCLSGSVDHQQTFGDQLKRTLDSELTTEERIELGIGYVLGGLVQELPLDTLAV